jgi:hypothetical protein
MSSPGRAAARWYSQAAILAMTNEKWQVEKWKMGIRQDEALSLNAYHLPIRLPGCVERRSSTSGASIVGSVPVQQSLDLSV